MEQKLQAALMRFDVLAAFAMEDGQLERAATFRQVTDELREEFFSEETE